MRKENPFLIIKIDLNEANRFSDRSPSLVNLSRIIYVFISFLVVNCTVPTVARGRGDKKVVSYLQQVNYTCDTGYSINGSEAATCTENGTLTELKPVCNSKLSHFLVTNTTFSKICIPNISDHNHNSTLTWNRCRFSENMIICQIYIQSRFIERFGSPNSWYK